MSQKTPAGHEFDYYKPNDELVDPVFVVLRISGEYSGVSWDVQCVADSLDAAMAWMDEHPLTPGKYNPVGYEVQPCQRATREVPS